MTQTTATTQPVKPDAVQEQHRYYRIERQFSSQRRPNDLVRDLLRAHCGE